MWTREYTLMAVTVLAACCTLVSSAAAKVIYVDDDATRANNGSSWESAYLCLQEALAAATYGDEIRVAQGTYKPDQKAVAGRFGYWITASGDREATFELKNGVILGGGYAGLGERDPDVRDVRAYATVLSGDLKGNDIEASDPLSLLDDPRRSDNSYHVVTNESPERASTVDGFTIVGGHANDATSEVLHHIGGGFYNTGVLTLANCTFRANAATFSGGGIHSEGNGVLSRDASLTLTNCRFSRNYGGGGGAIRSLHGRLAVTESTFVANSAGTDSGGRGWGGAIYSEDSETSITKCTFRGNRACEEGGGVASAKYCELVLGDCLFVGNASKQGRGGAITNRAMSSLTLANCTLIGNGAGNMGGAVFTGWWSDTTLTNSILWGNTCGSDMSTPSQIASLDRPAAIDYCCVQGLTSTPGNESYRGRGNIDTNPRLTADGHLCADSPCIDAGGTSGRPDASMTDSDGDTRFANGRIDMGADEFVDSDGDGLPNWWEQVHLGSTHVADPSEDLDGDGLTNLDEYEHYSSYPTAAPLGVNRLEGPFRTIQDAIDAARDGDTILVASGTYTGPNNKNLDFHGKAIVLRAPDGPEATIIDCQGEGRAFDFHSGETAGAAVLGFTIRNGRAEQGAAIRCETSNPQFRNCVLVHNSDPDNQGAALYARLAMLTLADCAISENTPRGISVDSGGVQILGTVRLASNDGTGRNVMLYGAGTLCLPPGVLLDLRDCRIRCDIAGPGTIQVPLDSELIVEADALVDLGHETDPHGAILCDGLLRAKDEAIIANAQVRVTRASFEDNAIIANCIFKAEAGAPYGQFFIEDRVQLWLDGITADGDRYLDLDPRVFDCNSIHVAAINVYVTEGIGGTHGGLFELRGRDLAVPSCGPDEFLCPVEKVPDFGPDTWTLDRLELVHGAKLNLTNRFDFQAPYDVGGEFEVLYVRELVLGPNSVLNTAFNRLYYETLIMAPTAEVVHVPLLGFSLNNITFDDENDFRTRVTHNNHLDVDEQPPDATRIHVERIVGHELDPNGVMRMCNLRDIDPDSPTRGQTIRARAKGLFAKSSEDEILIRFEYLFTDPAGKGELVIYLSDTPEMLDPSDPLRELHYLEVARLRHPPAGRPGSAASATWGVFEQVVSRGDLDFVRGTRIEFELIGPAGTGLLVNNWDPAIRCTMTCGDVAGAYHQVDAVDFLAALSECGRRIDEVPTPGSFGAWCLDGFFCADGYVTTDDATAIDWVAQKNLCPAGLLAADLGPLTFAPDTLPTAGKGGVSATAAAGQLDSLRGELLVAGKRYEPRENAFDDFLSDRLYGMDRHGNLVSGPSALGQDRLNGKLARDQAGSLYQVNLERGLVRIADDATVVGPVALPVPSEPRHGAPATVYIGFQSQGRDHWGRPVLDAAFDAQGNIYLVPVVVVPVTGAPYPAAAKLATGQDPLTHSIVQLFDDPPMPNDNLVTDQLREIEVDPAGNVYILNCHCNNSSDILWAYRGDGQLLARRELRELDICAPVGLCVSTYAPWKLYLSSSRNRPDSMRTKIYVLSSDKLVLSEVIQVQNLGHVTGIAEDPLDGTLCVVGFAMPAIPTQGAIQDAETILNTGPFYEPRLAIIPYGTPGPVEATDPSETSPHCDLALPLSVTWTQLTEDRVDLGKQAAKAAWKR